MGALYLYTHTGRNWVFTQKITPQGGIHGAAFGTQTLVLNSGQVVASAEKVRTALGTSGAIYNYLPNADLRLWVENPLIAAYNHDYTNARYGNALTACQNKIAISAYMAKIDETNNSGCVAVYDLEGKATNQLPNPFQNKQVRVFPNPVANDEIITIESQIEEIACVSIYNQLGNKIVYIKKYNNTKVNISAQTISKGFYIIQTTLKNGTTCNETLFVY